MTRVPPAPLSVVTGVSWTLELSPKGSPREGPELIEVRRDQLVEVFRGQRLQPGTPELLDRVARRWRCFVLFEDGTLVHHTFLGHRSRGPYLFRVATLESHRGRGLFRTAVAQLGALLHAEGEHSIRSVCASSNLPSMRAHAAAGFRETDRSTDIYLFGRSVRRAAGKAKRLLLRDRLQ